MSMSAEAVFKTEQFRAMFAYRISRLVPGNNVNVNIKLIARGKGEDLVRVVFVLVAAAQERVAVVVFVYSLHGVLDGSGSI